VTESRSVDAGHPVCGSIRWCTSTPPRRHRRRTTLLVATPPSGRVIAAALAIAWSESSTTTRHDPPAHSGPATRTSPPNSIWTDSAPASSNAAATMSPARPLPMPPGSNRVAGGRHTAEISGKNSIRALGDGDGSGKGPSSSTTASHVRS